MCVCERAKKKERQWVFIRIVFVIVFAAATKIRNYVITHTHLQTTVNNTASTVNDDKNVNFAFISSFLFDIKLESSVFQFEIPFPLHSLIRTQAIYSKFIAQTVECVCVCEWSEIVEETKNKCPYFHFILINEWFVFVRVCVWFAKRKFTVVLAVITLLHFVFRIIMKQWESEWCSKYVSFRIAIEMIEIDDLPLSNFHHNYHFTINNAIMIYLNRTQ